MFSQELLTFTLTYFFIIIHNIFKVNLNAQSFLKSYLIALFWIGFRTLVQSISFYCYLIENPFVIL